VLARYCVSCFAVKILLRVRRATGECSGKKSGMSMKKAGSLVLLLGFVVCWRIVGHHVFRNRNIEWFGVLVLDDEHRGRPGRGGWVGGGGVGGTDKEEKGDWGLQRKKGWLGCCGGRGVGETDLGCFWVVVVSVGG